MDGVIFVIRLTLVALLYAFLVAVFIVLWRDLRAAKESSVVVQERKASLAVLESCDGLEQGAQLSLKPFTTLGRSAGSTIVIPDAFASSEHALISWRGGQWWLEDLGSRNGTRLNDVAVTAPVVLSEGDLIAIGQVKLRVEINDE